MTIAVPPENSSLTNVPSPRTSLIFFVLALGAFAIGTAEFTAMSLVPLIARELQVTVPQAGHAIVAYAMGVGIGAPLIAVLSARLSHKKTLIGLTTLYMVGNGLTAFVPSYGYLLICRFISGLPHGAYFGIAGIIASSLVPPSRRTQAVSRVVLGLTVATVAGVPLASIIGSALGWRWSFGLIAALALITTVLVSVVVPTDPSRPHANAMAQLRGLKNRQVWLTLGISAVGFGGIFCVYTYLTAIMQEVLHASSTMIAIMLAVHAAYTVLWPAIDRLTAENPDINVEINIEGGLVDIVAERYDAGIRLGERLEQDMIAVPISPRLRMAAVASPSYLSGKTIPETPYDLAHHNCINLRLPTSGGLYAWEFERDGKEIRVKTQGQLVFNDINLIVESALTGHGIAFMLEDHVKDHLSSGTLVRILEDWCEPFDGYYLYYPSRRQPSPAFTLVLDALRYRGG